MNSHVFLQNQNFYILWQRLLINLQELNHLWSKVKPTAELKFLGILHH